MLTGGLFTEASSISPGLVDSIRPFDDIVGTFLSPNFHDIQATLALSLRVIEAPISPSSSGLSFACNSSSSQALAQRPLSPLCILVSQYGYCS